MGPAEQLYLQIILALVLIILYTVTLVKVCRGSGYRLVIGLIVLLIISNVGIIGNCICCFGTFVDETKKASIFVDVMISVTF